MRKYELDESGRGKGAARSAAPEPPRPPAAGLSTIAYFPVSASAGTVGTVASALTNHAFLAKDQPVAKVEIFRRDARIKKHSKGEGVPIGGVRGVIREFTDQSMNRLLFVVKNCDVDFFSMMTLTYPREFPTDGRKVKGHLKAFKASLETKFLGVQGIWWMEFQNRGAPHFHILLSVDLASEADRMGVDLVFRKRKRHASKGYWTLPDFEAWLSQRWYDIVDSGDPAHLRAGTAWEQIDSTEGALKYTAAHASKRKQKQVPADFQNVGRPWGKIGKVECEKYGEAELTTAEVFEILGVAALSGKGRVKKYLYDAAGRFEYES